MAPAAAGAAATAAATPASEPTVDAPSGSAESSADAASAPAAEPAKPTVRKIEYKEAKPVDLLETAGTPVLKRIAPLAVVGIILLFILRRLRSSGGAE